MTGLHGALTPFGTTFQRLSCTYVWKPVMYHDHTLASGMSGQQASPPMTSTGNQASLKVLSDIDFDQSTTLWLQTGHNHSFNDILRFYAHAPACLSDLYGKMHCKSPQYQQALLHVWNLGMPCLTSSKQPHRSQITQGWLSVPVKASKDSIGYLRKSAFSGTLRFSRYSNCSRFFTICLISTLVKYCRFSKSSNSGIISSAMYLSTQS